MDLAKGYYTSPPTRCGEGEDSSLWELEMRRIEMRREGCYTSPPTRSGEEEGGLLHLPSH
ncbi:hypothetical protein [Oryza sativa Japonica Group]|uniref:Uncharacterized protein n=1 Tax=Oryza sativa subsp. japonica TaxID=39947 RepID=Q657A6_ORYSJ|nr:hypothetical protein [Oryza sativa Japonica Group]BAD45119.1 hypothetical protein [Oryza sativa Japonica Group]